ncbi:MAG: hypothetical protein NC320_08245 [Clostridium sp.]|nr:hypothetical protein [Clostridium sp.]MCM1547848.1 hypothetical protein [Ruminococcus sp.]
MAVYFLWNSGITSIIYLLAGAEIGVSGHLMLFIGTGCAGLAFGVLNERLFSGSIIPSILLHGMINFSSSLSEALGWTDKVGVYSAYIVIVISIAISIITAKRNIE